MTLSAKDLSFSYPGAGPVLAGVTLSVAPGERLALRGRSGRGKTTLCRLLAGHLAPTGGRVLVDGASLDPRARGPRPVQLLPQHPERAFDPHLRLRRSLAEAGEGALDPDLLCRLGVDPAWLDRLPHELSGGELMRLAVVRAIACAPRYLIADESTAMLDAITQDELWRALMAWQAERGAGIVLVSHSPALVARVSTRVLDL